MSKRKNKPIVISDDDSSTNDEEDDDDVNSSDEDDLVIEPSKRRLTKLRRKDNRTVDINVSEFESPDEDPDGEEEYKFGESSSEEESYAEKRRRSRATQESLENSTIVLGPGNRSLRKTRSRAYFEDKGSEEKVDIVIPISSGDDDEEEEEEEIEEAVLDSEEERINSEKRSKKRKRGLEALIKEQNRPKKKRKLNTLQKLKMDDESGSSSSSSDEDKDDDEEEDDDDIFSLDSGVSKELFSSQGNNNKTRTKLSKIELPTPPLPDSRLDDRKKRRTSRVSRKAKENIEYLRDVYDPRELQQVKDFIVDNDDKDALEEKVDEEEPYDYLHQGKRRSDRRKRRELEREEQTIEYDEEEEEHVPAKSNILKYVTTNNAINDDIDDDMTFITGISPISTHKKSKKKVKKNKPGKNRRMDEFNDFFKDTRSKNTVKNNQRRRRRPKLKKIPPKFRQQKLKVTTTPKKKKKKKKKSPPKTRKKKKKIYDWMKKNLSDEDEDDLRLDEESEDEDRDDDRDEEIVESIVLDEDEDEEGEGELFTSLCQYIASCFIDSSFVQEITKKKQDTKYFKRALQDFERKIGQKIRAYQAKCRDWNKEFLTAMNRRRERFGDAKKTNIVQQCECGRKVPGKKVEFRGNEVITDFMFLDDKNGFGDCRVWFEEMERENEIGVMGRRKFYLEKRCVQTARSYFAIMHFKFNLSNSIRKKVMEVSQIVRGKLKGSKSQGDVDYQTLKKFLGDKEYLKKYRGIYERILNL